nr:MAG TPA: hypothetical protein [Caudoviricetes sp.]
MYQFGVKFFMALLHHSNYITTLSYLSIGYIIIF